MAARGSKAFITTNFINYFFGVVNLIVGLFLASSYQVDQAYTFLIISLAHWALTLHVNSKGSRWKRYFTLILANLSTAVLGYAAGNISVPQILLFVLLIGISSLLFGSKEKKSLALWFSIPFALLIISAISLAAIQSPAPGEPFLTALLSVLTILAIAVGLGSTVLKVRQVQVVLDTLLRTSDKEGDSSSSLSAANLELIKNDISERDGVYKLLATHSKDIILLFSKDGIISYISPAVQAILGYEPAEVVGKNVQDFINPKARSFEGDGPGSDFSVRAKDGNYVWLEATLQKIYDENGGHIQTQGILRDVTEQKWLNEVLRQTTQLARIGGWETDVISERSTYTDSLASLLGYPKGEVPTKDEVLKRFTKSSGEKLEKAYRDVYESQKGFDTEIELMLPSGATSWVRIVVVPKVEDGRLIKVIGSLIDINERKKNEIALKELAMIARNSSSATVITDKDGKIEWVNEGFTQMTGYALDEIKGKSPGSFLQGPESDPAVKKAMRDSIANGDSFRGEIINYHKTGEAYWVEILINPVFGEDGEVLKFVAIENDVSERKATEWELLAAKKAAEEASVAKERFLSTMTHEIRTPLNAVIGMSKILMGEDPRKDQLDLLQTLHYSAENLLTLINDILDFTKISSEKIQFENIPFKFNEEVGRAVSSMKFKAQEKGNTLSFAGDPAIPTLLEGDIHRIVQVLTNLIGNAAKFTENGEIKVATKIVSQKSNTMWVRFSVSDTGIGLDKNKLELIFEKFSQADASTSRKYGGTGLGLAICKMIVEQQGGRIWAEGKHNEGATFFFEIPLKTTNHNIKLDQQMTNQLESLEQIRVLTVDDNQINQLVLDRFLKKWNVSFKQANNGREAIELANKERFDIILMDLEMPVVDGYHATREIREASKFNSETPIIALTASTRKEVEGRVFDAGMNDVMMKPFNPVNLHQLLMDYTMPEKVLHHVA